MSDYKDTVTIGQDLQEKKGEWEMVFKKEFETRTGAIKFENFIKKQKSKKFIESLINNFSGVEE